MLDIVTAFAATTVVIVQLVGYTAAFIDNS